MDAETIRLLISAVTGVVGALVGAGGALIASERQHRRALERERVAEARARARRSAQECDRAFDQLARDIPTQRRVADMDEEYRLRADRIRANCDRIELLAVDLPPRCKQRVLEGQSFMQHADDMGAGGYGQAPHYHSIALLTHNVNRHVHDLLSAFLRNESRLPRESEVWIEYRAAYADLVRVRENEYAAEIAEADSDRSQWLEEHPEVVKQVRAWRSDNQQAESD